MRDHDGKIRYQIIVNAKYLIKESFKHCVVQTPCDNLIKSKVN